ncbi:MAG: hypothetical protein FJ220_05575 [Kiritimatiellaceae bacterium]|nr:hypothetical protein [Kiritimatiellaceae bacterium]
MKLKPKISLMVQAIKSLGRDAFDAVMISALRNAFSQEDRRQVLKDAPVVSDWSYELIRKICAEEPNGYHCNISRMVAGGAFHRNSGVMKMTPVIPDEAQAVIKRYFKTRFERKFNP